MNKHDKLIVVGYGEIGKAYTEVLDPFYDIGIVDLNYTDEFVQDWTERGDSIASLHICIPYNNSFKEAVNEYKKKYNPNYIVIHSTVPVGTCKDLGATHVPVRGKHPHLAESIKTFVNFVSGNNADEVADYLRYAGLRVQIFRDSNTTELGKIISTTHYGIEIQWVKEVEKLCKKHNVPFSEAYTMFQQTYNEGYQKLGYPEFTRPVLQPLQKKIGGHCVRENTEFLDSKFIKIINEKNLTEK